VERVSIRTTSLIRAVIVTSLVGHWLANALFDLDEYSGAGSDLLTRLDDPFFAQAALGLLAIAVLSIRGRSGGSGPRITAGRLPLAVLLVGLQLVLFVGLEASERWAVDVFAQGEAHVGIFGAGFVAELLVAVGSALILAVVADATKRFLELQRSAGPHTARGSNAPPCLGFPPSVGILSGAGGVRAPPR
jgi:hypothetical protein